MKKLRLSFLIILSSVSSYSQNVRIGLASQNKAEEITRKKLVHILEEYNVEKWIFTDTLVISSSEIPHSHPVLTLNTRPQSDLSLLAVFIHENAHWHLVEKEQETNLAIGELKKKFPSVPVGGGEGARDEYSTYLHLIVNFLEYDGIEQIAGERASKAVLNRKPYYKWIYKQVLNNLEYLREITVKYGLSI